MPKTMVARLSVFIELEVESQHDASESANTIADKIDCIIDAGIKGTVLVTTDVADHYAYSHAEVLEVYPEDDGSGAGGDGGDDDGPEQGGGGGDGSGAARLVLVGGLAGS